MNWFQKIANEQDWDDSDEKMWTYEDYKRHLPKLEDSYESIGHTSENTGLFYIDNNLRYHYLSPEEVIEHAVVNDNLRNHNIFPKMEGTNILDFNPSAWGRVDLDKNEVSLKIEETISDRERIKIILETVYDKLYDKQIFVWYAMGEEKIPFQQFFERYASGSIQKIADFEFDDMKEHIRQLLDAADESLPYEAQNAITNFVGHEPDSRDTGIGGLMISDPLEEAYSDNPGEKGMIVRQQLESVFHPIKEQLRRLIGDSISLFRHQKPYDNSSARNILSWTLNLEFAQHLYGPDQVQTYNIIGSDGWTVKMGLPQERAEEIATAINAAGSITPEIQARYRIEDETIDAPVTIQPEKMMEQPDRGELQNEQIPWDRVVWATDRANQMEFIVRTSNLHRTSANSWLNRMLKIAKPPTITPEMEDFADRATEAVLHAKGYLEEVISDYVNTPSGGSIVTVMVNHPSKATKGQGAETNTPAYWDRQNPVESAEGFTPDGCSITIYEYVPLPPSYRDQPDRHRRIKKDVLHELVHCLDVKLNSDLIDEKWHSNHRRDTRRDDFMSTDQYFQSPWEQNAYMATDPWDQVSMWKRNGVTLERALEDLRVHIPESKAEKSYKSNPKLWKEYMRGMYEAVQQIYADEIGASA